MNRARWVITSLMMMVWIVIQPSPLHAACDRFPLMNRLIGLWEHGQRNDGLSIEQASEIHKFISNSDFADVLQRLRVADRGGSYGHAMQLIADMSRLSSLALADQPDGVRMILQDPQISARVSILQTELSSSCDQPGGADGSVDDTGGLMRTTAPGSDPRGFDLSGGSGGVSEGLDPNKTLQNIPVTGGGRLAQQDPDVRELGLVVGFLLALCATIVIVHLSMLALRALRRYRKTCQVPAVLSLSILEVPGHIFVAGRYGCGFVPDEDLDADALSIMSMGTYCQVSVGRKTIYAKLLQDAADTVGLRFSDPVEIADLKEIFSHSLTRPKFDLGAAAVTGSRPFFFGEGRMIRP